MRLTELAVLRIRDQRRTNLRCRHHIPQRQAASRVYLQSDWLILFKSGGQSDTRYHCRICEAKAVVRRLEIWSEVFQQPKTRRGSQQQDMKREEHRAADSGTSHSETIYTFCCTSVDLLSLRTTDDGASDVGRDYLWEL